MIVRAATPDDIRHVCQNLRPHNAREAFALRFDDDPQALAADLIALSPFAIMHVCCAGADGVPVALIGAWLTGPRLAGLALRATPQWLTIGPAVYRFLHQVFVPCALAPNVALAETEVLADGPDRAWLARLGCVECHPALPRGKHGEMFLRVAWINPRREEVYGS